MFVAVLWLALSLFAAADLFFSLYFFRRLQRIPKEIHEANAWLKANVHAIRPVSVIICGRNEAENFQQNLPRIFDQDYFFENGKKAFEVIVVNDASNDESESVLKSFIHKNPELRIISIEQDAVRRFPGKKFPLSLALEAAVNEWVVCIDADCNPDEKDWLKSLSSAMNEQNRIIAGYGGVRKTGGFLNWFVRYETMHTFLMYYSFTDAGRPYMAVGRNLAAKKEAYLFAQQQKVWSELPSGDDDLLVQLCATGNNMKVVASPQSFTRTDSKRDWKEYLAQKRRHVSTGKFYGPATKFYLGFYAFLKALVWPLLFAAFCCQMPVEAFLLLLVPFLVQSILFRQATITMQERSEIPGWALFFFCWMLYNAVLAPYILWKSRQHWK